MTYNPALSLITNGGEFDMTAASTFDLGMAVTAQAFKFCFRDVNQNGSTQGFTLRFNAGSLVTSGYDSVCVQQPVDGGTTVVNTSTIRFDVQGISGLGLSRGYIEGRLADPTTDVWNVNGQFYDDFDDTTMTLWGNIDLGQNASGFRLQSAPASNYAAGFFSYQYWT